MALRLLIDGYNVIAPVAPPSGIDDPNWLHRERMRLIRRLSDRFEPKLARRTCIVFDAADPPKDRPSRFEFEGLKVHFAVDYPEADDLIEEIIASHSAPKRLAVVSSDHRVQTAAKRRGGHCFDSQDWMDDLLDGRIHLAGEVRRVSTAERSADDTDWQGQGGGERKKADPGSVDVDHWLDEFGF